MSVKRKSPVVNGLNNNLIIWFFYERSGKGSSTWKIAGGVTVVCSGGVIAAALAYSYSTEFRSFVHKNLPGVEPFLGTFDNFINNRNKQPDDQQINNVQGDTRSLSSAGDPLNLGLSTPKGAQKVRYLNF